MRLLFDENLSPAHAQRARRLGHDALSVLEAGLSAEPDSGIRDYAITENRVLVTLDADFANILRFPPDATPGVIRLRVHPPTESALCRLLEWALPRLRSRALTGKLVVVEAGRIRIR